MSLTITAIRPDNVGFSREKERYIEHAQKEILPACLENLKYSLPWPVDMSDPQFHISNFSTPIGEIYAQLKETGDTSDVNLGVDIQGNAGTKVSAIESGIVTYCSKDKRPLRGNLADIVVKSKSGIEWSYGHLEFKTLPQALKQICDKKINKNSPVEIHENDVIGEIGSWNDGEELDGGALYRYGLHHLDLIAINSINGIKEPYFNPLLLLKKLYTF